MCIISHSQIGASIHALGRSGCAPLGCSSGGPPEMRTVRLKLPGCRHWAARRGPAVWGHWPADRGAQACVQATRRPDWRHAPPGLAQDTRIRRHRSRRKTAPHRVIPPAPLAAPSRRTAGSSLAACAGACPPRPASTDVLALGRRAATSREDCAHTDTMASKALIGSSGASVGRSGEDTAPAPAKGLNPIPGWTGWQAQGSLPQLPAAWRPQVPPRQLGAYPPAFVTPGIGNTGNGRHSNPAATDKAPIGSTTAPVERTMASGAELAPKVVPTTVPPGGGAAAPGGHQSGAPGSCLAPRPRPNPIATSLMPVA